MYRYIKYMYCKSLEFHMSKIHTVHCVDTFHNVFNFKWNTHGFIETVHDSKQSFSKRV